MPGLPPACRAERELGQRTLPTVRRPEARVTGYRYRPPCSQFMLTELPGTLHGPHYTNKFPNGRGSARQSRHVRNNFRVAS